MTVAQLLDSVQLVVDKDGKPTAALVEMEAWTTLLALVAEELEERTLLQERAKKWRTKEDWTPWPEFEAELDAEA